MSVNCTQCENKIEKRIVIIYYNYLLIYIIMVSLLPYYLQQRPVKRLQALREDFNDKIEYIRGDKKPILKQPEIIDKYFEQIVLIQIIKIIRRLIPFYINELTNNDLVITISQLVAQQSIFKLEQIKCMGISYDQKYNSNSLCKTSLYNHNSPFCLECNDFFNKTRVECYTCHKLLGYLIDPECTDCYNMFSISDSNLIWKWDPITRTDIYCEFCDNEECGIKCKYCAERGITTKITSEEDIDERCCIKCRTCSECEIECNHEEAHEYLNDYQSCYGPDRGDIWCTSCYEKALAYSGTPMCACCR